MSELSEEQLNDEIRTQLDMKCIKEIQKIVNGSITEKQPYSSNAILRIKAEIAKREKQLI